MDPSNKSEKINVGMSERENLWFIRIANKHGIIQVFDKVFQFGFPVFCNMVILFSCRILFSIQLSAMVLRFSCLIRYYGSVV